MENVGQQEVLWDARLNLYLFTIFYFPWFLKEIRTTIHIVFSFIALEPVV